MKTRRYQPIQSQSAHPLAPEQAGPAAAKLKQNRAQQETPQKKVPFIKIANPVTKGDHTAGHNRYEKGRVDKSRS